MATATISATNVFAGTCPAGNVYDLVTQLINQGVQVTITDSPGSITTPYNQSATPPPAAGRLWYRQGGTTFAPFPAGIYGYYNGRWVPYVTPQVGTVRMIAGSPDGLFDSTGKGLFVPATDTPNIAGIYYGWAYCNSQNGTRDLRNRFVQMGDSYDDPTNLWVAQNPQPDGSRPLVAQGGRSGTSLVKENLPVLDVWNYNANATQTVPRPYGGVLYDNSPTQALPHQANQVDVSDNYPRFGVCGAVQWIGYGV